MRGFVAFCAGAVTAGTAVYFGTKHYYKKKYQKFAEDEIERVAQYYRNKYGVNDTEGEETEAEAEVSSASANECEDEAADLDAAVEGMNAYQHILHEYGIDRPEHDTYDIKPVDPVKWDKITWPEDSVEIIENEDVGFNDDEDQTARDIRYAYFYTDDELEWEDEETKMEYEEVYGCFGMFPEDIRKEFNRREGILHDMEIKYGNRPTCNAITQAKVNAEELCLRDRSNTYDYVIVKKDVSYSGDDIGE